MELAYFEKKVVLTRDKKKEKTYSYGTLTIRSKQLTPFIGKKVRILIKSIETGNISKTKKK